MKKKPSKGFQTAIIAILVLAVMYISIDMIIQNVGLNFSMLWHWIFIVCFSFTTLFNVRAKNYIGISIGLSGMWICVLSLILMAI
ncbi:MULTISPECIES: hypothetical protein [Listeria]|uniref:hypothetical protein n=1 Tax=Listeria TaxID=1637 RepID=UPI000B58B7B2|nr:MULTISPECIES: hypothetical protein [Listeria]